MKKLIFILFFIPLIASGTNYYISSTDGSDSDSGLTSDLAWETITKVNSVSFAAGDSVFFKRGDTFIGTLTPASSGTSVAYITFGAYGTGNKPIITPNAEVVGLTWTLHSGTAGIDAIYKTTDVGYNPGNILINGTTKINKINDYWVTNTPVDGAYWNYTALQLLAVDDSAYLSVDSYEVYFWDGLEALYCYESATTTTYLRFRYGENPNDSVLAISVASGNTIYINSKSYLIFQNLNIVGGENGIYITGVADNGDTDNIIIENCTIESSNRKVFFRNDANGIIVRNDTLTNNYLSSYTPGGYDGGSTYESNVAYHYYRFFKNRLATSQSTDVDQGVYNSGTTQANNSIYGNVIINCVNGIGIPGSNCSVYNNYIENTSSVAIHCGELSDSATIYSNYMVNCDLPFRFQYIDETARAYFIYRNRVYNEDAGVCMYLHYGPTIGPSVVNTYFYHNSFISKKGIDCSSYIVENPESSGFVFVNNIFSIEGNNTEGTSEIATKTNCFVFYYNWMGGTYYGASGLPGQISLWATDASNINRIGETFWDHSIDPPDFENTLEWEGEVIDAGIDISAPFTLGVVNYSALPGIDPSDYQDDPDIGYYEYGLPDAIVLTTLRPQWTSSTTALGGGNVVADGGTDVTERGVCWNTTGTPTTADDKVAHASGGVGSYIVTLTPLVRGTVYYVRAYAINSEGTSYGDEYRFQKLILHKGNKALFSSTGKILYID